ncbi:hypothetical protein M0805_008988 [Coniferiporia weirii]|nr:hypothetical protein M0805_008988 [Coniferiporia weirii]
MSSERPQAKRTYGSRGGKPRQPAVSYSSDTSPSPSSTGERDIICTKRKRPLTDIIFNGMPPKKKISPKNSTATDGAKAKDRKKAATLTQLHFSIDQSILRTCPICDLTYTRGAPDDEILHKTHCIRVQKGMEWGREEKERERTDGDIVVVEEDVMLTQGDRGRIVAVKASSGGRLGNKLATYLKTVNLALSAPDITPPSLENSKAYLFLLRTKGSTREKIVGCVLAQRISTAMKIATQDEVALGDPSSSLIHVEGNLYCTTERVPTPMGVPRLFVSSAYRRRGIAQALLAAAAKTFIYGCELDPTKGEVAFSQPTSMGRTVMEKWGKGAVRIYEE